MNELELILEKIEKNYDLNNLFSIGLYLRYANTKRIYLDNIKKEGIDLFMFLLELIEKYMRKHLSDSIYICLMNYEWTYQKELSTETVNQLKRTGINIPELCAKREYYDFDDEWYVKLYFYEESLDNIKKYLWGILAGHCLVQPNSFMDMFFISKDLSALLNVYDDRGMDLKKLNIM